ncbi:MAG: histidine kinase dimerization/phospho-acceptor domain-containing protein, partial [Clostridia bacterium]
MLKRIPLRLRLTLLSILLLAACCVGLTIVLNLSAYHMADAIEAIPMMPSIPLTPSIKPPPAAETSASHLSEKSQRARSTFSYQSILYMLFVVAIGGGLTYNLSGKALQPLRELSHQMHHRTVHNLSQALPVPKSHDEIADLTRAFNEMSRKLGDVFAMQKRFSQSAAHELRTPLAVLQTKVEVFAKKKEHTAVEYDQLLSVITTHTHRLTNLVKDLLDLTNMDALACDETIALKALLAEVTAALSEPAKEKNVSLTLVGEEQMIRGNRTLL